MTPQQRQASEESLARWAMDRGALRGAARRFAEAMVAVVASATDALGVYSVAGLRATGHNPGDAPGGVEDDLYLVHPDGGVSSIAADYVLDHAPRPGSWAGAVQAWGKSLKPLRQVLAASWKAANESEPAMPRECPRELLRPHLRQVGEEQFGTSTAPFAAGLSLAVGIDDGNCVVLAHQRHLDAWGMTLDEALRVSWESLRVAPPTHVRGRPLLRDDGAVVAVLLRDREGYASARAVAEAPVGSVLFLVAQESAMVVFPGATEEEIAAVARATRKFVGSHRLPSEHVLCGPEGPTPLVRLATENGVPRVEPVAIAQPADGGAS